MVSSVAPIKAKKLRYYADANFKRRVLPPPVLGGGVRRRAAGPADDWSGLAIPAVPAAPAAASADGLAPGTDDGGPRRQPELPKPSPTTPTWPRPQPTSGCSMTTTCRFPPAPARPGPAAHGPAGFPRPQRRNRAMSHTA
jgi:type IV secretion system protein VirD4